MKCVACGKGHHEVRKLVSLSPDKAKQVYLCNECIDMCSEIVHEDGGFVQIAVSELEQLRKRALDAEIARIWIDGVRRAVADADANTPGRPA